MSTVRYFKGPDGEKIVLPSDQDIKSELRCDGCGEFLSPAGAVHGQVTVSSLDGQPPINFDAHPNHAGGAVEAIGVALSQLHD